MKKIALLLFLIFAFSGCASVYSVRVNDYLDSTQTAAPVPAGASFFVMENNNEKNPILEREIKSKIERMLVEHGYMLASYDKAEYFIDFAYSINSGRSISEVRPEYNPGGTETIHTYRSNGRSSTSIVTLPGYTTYVPYKVTVYTSSLTLNILDAASLRNSNAKRIIWIGENSVASESPDLRNAVNYLLVASFAHFGENTGRSIIMNIPEDDPRVKKILE